jgi:hypothetical protein
MIRSRLSETSSDASRAGFAPRLRNFLSAVPP